MNKKAEQVRRFAQFLFENADVITKELRKTKHYRAITAHLNMHKYQGKPELKIEFSIYDETTTHYPLKEDYICTKEFKILCNRMNMEANFTKPPKKRRIRKKL